MKTGTLFLAATALALPLFVAGCGGSSGGGGPGPDGPGPGFAAGDTIPGFLLQPPTEGRAQLMAEGTYAGGVWVVMFKRTLTTPETEEDIQFNLTNASNQYPLGVAILDNAKGEMPTMGIQDNTVYTFGGVGSGADVQAKQETPADATSFTGPTFTTAGGAGMAVPVTFQAAYDSTYVYLLATWDDFTSTLNDQKERWEFDGTTWTQTDSSVNDEDRISIWWPINFADFDNGGTDGCLSLCHIGANRMGTTDLTARADLWHWKAARTNPLGFSDEQQLKQGTWNAIVLAGRSNDSGRGIDVKNQNSGMPKYMAEDNPNDNAKFLLRTLPDDIAVAGAQRGVPFLR